MGCRDLQGDPSAWPSRAGGPGIDAGIARRSPWPKSWSSTSLVPTTRATWRRSWRHAATTWRCTGRNQARRWHWASGRSPSSTRNRGLGDERVEAVVARVLEDGLIQRVWLFHAD